VVEKQVIKHCNSGCPTAITRFFSAFSVTLDSCRIENRCQVKI
jgi:hypothetical protein